MRDRRRRALGVSGGASRYYPTGEDSPTAKLTQTQADEIRERRAAGELLAPLASEYGVSRALICDVAAGRRYG